MHLAWPATTLRGHGDLLCQRFRQFYFSPYHRFVLKLNPRLAEVELNIPPPGSVFYNLPDNTDSFFSRGALLFFAILMNAFASALEVNAHPRIVQLFEWVS
jgi:hypothetical protein